MLNNSATAFLFLQLIRVLAPGPPVIQSPYKSEEFGYRRRLLTKSKKWLLSRNTRSSTVFEKYLYLVNRMKDEVISPSIGKYISIKKTFTNLQCKYILE